MGCKTQKKNNEIIDPVRPSPYKVVRASFLKFMDNKNQLLR